MGDRDRHDVVSSEAMRDFLVAVRERCDLALQQNDTIDILQDDFGSLTAEETAVGGGADGDMRELMSFTHLVYCAGKMHRSGGSSARRSRACSRPRSTSPRRRRPGAAPRSLRPP